MPPWWDGHKLNEVAFCNAFIKEHPMVSVEDTFFTVDGRVDDEALLRQEIYNRISPYVTGAVSKRVHDLVEVLRLQCYTPSLPLHTDRIHVANGTLFLNGTFTEAKEYCRNRLPVTFKPDADVLKCWLDFLMQLLTQEDIVTLQEFMGYCLIPSTKGQASSGALFRVYRQWCDDNATPSFSQKSFCASVKQLASQYGLQYTNKIPLSDGRIVRGFTGISVLLPGFGK